MSDTAQRGLLSRRRLGRKEEEATADSPGGHVLRLAVGSCAVALLVASTALAEALAPPLVLQVIAKAGGGDSREVVATLVNRGPDPVVVLPNLVSLTIEGPGAEYVPYPGPPVDPWQAARELPPGAVATVTFHNLADRRGIWRLGRGGKYRLSASYVVPPELDAPAALAAGLWRGRIESPATEIVVR